MQYSYSTETQKFVLSLSKQRIKLSIEEEHALIKELREKETTNKRKEQIKQLFIANTILWVVSKVREKNGVIDDDLIQESIIGVMNALNDFDLKTNIKFITYANVHIFKQKYIYISEIAPTVFIPTNVQKIRNKIAKLPNDLGLDEIAEKLNIKQEVVASIVGANPTYVSKDDELTGLQIESQVIGEDNDFSENLNSFLKRISPKRALVVTYILGLNGLYKNYEELAKMLYMHPNTVEVAFCNTMIEFGKEMGFGTKKDEFIGRFKQRISEINSTERKFNDKQKELFA